MRTFKNVGLVEQLGSGMSHILKAYDRSAFEISEHFIKVTFPFYSVITSNGTINGKIKNNSETRKVNTETILSTIRKTPTVTLKQLATQLHCGRRTVSRRMKALQDEGKLKRTGSNKNGCWFIVEEMLP